MNEQEQEIPYEETRHLFNPDQDGAICEHVWRWQYNHATNRQMTRICVICHASSGFPADQDFLRARYITAENANLRHYIQMKAAEQQLQAMREEAAYWKQAYQEETSTDHSW